MAEHAEADKKHINKYKMAHMIGCAEYMRDNAYRYGLEDRKDEMYVIGLLHDVGYLGGRDGHERYGAELLRGMGLSEEHVYAIKNHRSHPDDLRKAGMAITPELLLLWDADLSIGRTGYNVGHYERLKDIRRRYGDDGAPRACLDEIRKYRIKRCPERTSPPKESGGCAREACER